MTTNVKAENTQSWENLKNIKTHTRQTALKLTNDIAEVRKSISQTQKLLEDKRNHFLAEEAEIVQKQRELEQEVQSVQKVDEDIVVQKNEPLTVEAVEKEQEKPAPTHSQTQDQADKDKKEQPSVANQQQETQKKQEVSVKADEKVVQPIKKDNGNANAQKKPNEQQGKKFAPAPSQVKITPAPKSVTPPTPVNPNAPRTYTDEKGNVKVRKFLVHQPEPPKQQTRQQGALQGQRRDKPNQRTDFGQNQGQNRERPPFDKQGGRFGAKPTGSGTFAKDKDSATASPSRPPLTKKPSSAPPPMPSREGKGFGNKNKTHDRPDDKKAISKKNLLTKTFGGIDDDERVRTRPRSTKKQEQAPVIIKKIEKAVVNSTDVPIKVLSEKIGKTVAEIIKELFKEGIIKTINDSIEYGFAAYVSSQLGVELELKIEKTAEDIITENDQDDGLPDNVKRPPIVTVMGHVDHGKTSLLDAIRSTNVTSSEAGGITQHIGASTVFINGEQITFIDTPGHSAFTKMRARGAKVTDVAIIVVAADDGVMPQTIEAISHAKAAEVAIMVAINKMDKPEANPDRVKQQLTEYGLLAEDWGGDTIMVPVSAKAEQGIEDLLESVLLLTEMKGLKANPDKKATGTVIEAELNKDKGPVATILVRNGTLRVGDSLVAGTATGKIKAMYDDKGKKLKSAGPSCPVSVLGFSFVPVAGDYMYVADEKLVRKVAEERKNKAKEQTQAIKPSMSLGDLFGKISEGKLKTLNLIIKTDVQGSLDAVKLSLTKISNEEVRINPIHGGVGGINETDVMLAKASDAIIIGFNVRADTNARAHAEKEGVDIRLYSVIYDAVDDITKAMKGMLAPKYKEVSLGTVTVRETFKISGIGTVAGCYVNNGKVTRNSKVRLYRNNIAVHDGAISALKRFKDDAKEVLQGFECGILLENFNDVKVDDVMEVYSMEQIEA